jgi:hypothetical protein
MIDPIPASNFSKIDLEMAIDAPFTRIAGLSVPVVRIYPVFSNAHPAIHRFASANKIRSCAVYFVNPR